MVASSDVVIRRLKERGTTDLALIFPVIDARSPLVDVFAPDLRSEIRAPRHPLDRASPGERRDLSQVKARGAGRS
jgi:hypothetical protein